MPLIGSRNKESFKMKVTSNIEKCFGVLGIYLFYAASELVPKEG